MTQLLKIFSLTHIWLIKYAIYCILYTYHMWHMIWLQISILIQWNHNVWDTPTQINKWLRGCLTLYSVETGEKQFKPYINTNRSTRNCTMNPNLQSKTFPPTYFRENSNLKICMGLSQKFLFHWIRIEIWSHMICICSIIKSNSIIEFWNSESSTWRRILWRIEGWYAWLILKSPYAW